MHDVAQIFLCLLQNLFDIDFLDLVVSVRALASQTMELLQVSLDQLVER